MSPMPAEKSAYALARYSRSTDSILESLEWVRTHNSMKFLESFYFQYGHASIADLGHVGICWEGISELAATEVEDEQLWDGQAKSTRYQDFSKLGFVTPPEFTADQATAFQAAGQRLLDAYADLHALKFAELTASLPRPDDMKPDAYERNLKARAFDVARYVLFFGIPTNVGQVTSIRTLEKQIRRLKASEFAEIRDVAGEAAQAVAEAPACLWHESVGEPVAPTLAKYVDADKHVAQANGDLRQWASQNLPAFKMTAQTDPTVELIRPSSAIVDIVASLLYPVTTRPYRDLYEWAATASPAVRDEVIDVALKSRSRYDELLKGFRGGQYIFDIVMDIGAYRDLHRHRRCIQLRQDYTFELGYGAPSQITAGPIRDRYVAAMRELKSTYDGLPQPAAQYLLPFGAHSRFLFKMDFAEIEYISKLRSGVKGHFSYRDIAWRMKLELEKVEPELARLIAATPPWEEDPLTR